MKKKLIALLSLSAILLTLFAACSSGDNTSDSSVTTPSGETTTVAEETGPDLFADVPTGKYDGYNFRILNNESNFALTQMDAIEQNGEPINDAVYDRNRLIEERLDVKITENMVGYSEVTSTIKNAIAAGEDSYDIFFNESYFVAPLALENYLVNVYELDKLNFDKPWWAGDMIDSLSIGDKLYILAGDIHLMLPEATWVMAFNKRILNDLSLENPYELVKNGSWTLDKLSELIHSSFADINGDGTMTADADLFGAALYINPTNLMISAGTNFVTKDGNNLPVFAGMTERDFSVYSKIVEKIYSTGEIAIDGKTSNMGDPWTSVFSRGNSLILVEPIGSLKRLRNMEDEFGIVPFTKYDEQQSDYISLTAHYSAVMGIPVTNSNHERTAVILEQMAAVSYRDIRPVYFDVILTGKYSRDNESEDMLDIVFDTRIFDLMSVYRWGNLIDTLNGQAGTFTTDITSAVEKVAPAVQTAIEKTIEFYSGS